MEHQQQQQEADICEFFSRLSGSSSGTLLHQEEKVHLVLSAYPTLIERQIRDGDHDHDDDHDHDHNDVIRNDPYQYLLSLLFTMIGYLRDKGQTTVAYWMLIVWYRYFPDDAHFLVEAFVENQNFRLFPEDPPYGSWRDLARIAALLRGGHHHHHHQPQAFPVDHPLLLKLENMTNHLRAAEEDDQDHENQDDQDHEDQNDHKEDVVAVLASPRYAILRDYFQSSHKK